MAKLGEPFGYFPEIHDMITLELENGEEVRCEVSGLVKIDDNDYIAVVAEDKDEVYIYKISETKEGLKFDNIFEDEYQMVAEKFLELAEEDEEIEKDDFDRELIPDDWEE